MNNPNLRIEYRVIMIEGYSNNHQKKCCFLARTEHECEVWIDQSIPDTWTGNVSYVIEKVYTTEQRR